MSTSKGPKRRSVKAEVKLLLDVCNECGVSSTARLYIACGLYPFTCERGRCWPGTDAIEQKTGLAERTQRKARAELEAAGILRVLKPPAQGNGVKGVWNIGAKAIPRGRWLFYVWPIANEAGKRECAELLMPEVKKANEHTQWFTRDADGKHGPFTTAAIIEGIKAGNVSRTRMLYAEGIGLLPAAMVPTFAGLFKLAA